MGRALHTIGLRGKARSRREHSAHRTSPYRRVENRAARARFRLQGAASTQLLTVTLDRNAALDAARTSDAFRKAWRKSAAVQLSEIMSSG